MPTNRQGQPIVTVHTKSATIKKAFGDYIGDVEVRFAETSRCGSPKRRGAVRRNAPRRADVMLHTVSGLTTKIEKDAASLDAIPAMCPEAMDWPQARIYDGKVDVIVGHDLVRNLFIPQSPK